MSKFEQSKRLFAASVALSVGTLTVSGIDSISSAATKQIPRTETQSDVLDHTKSKPEVCTPIDKARWELNSRVPLKVGKIASMLGVSVQVIEAGKFGGANCNPGFKGQDIADGFPFKIEVQGVSNECLVVGVKSQSVPNSSLTYNKVLALCAGTVKTSTTVA